MTGTPEGKPDIADVVGGIDECRSMLGKVHSVMALLSHTDPNPEQAQEAFAVLALLIETITNVLDGVREGLAA